MKKNWFAKAAASVTCLAMLVGCGSGGSTGAKNDHYQFRSRTT